MLGASLFMHGQHLARHSLQQLAASRQAHAAVPTAAAPPAAAAVAAATAVALSSAARAAPAAPASPPAGSPGSSSRGTAAAALLLVDAPDVLSLVAEVSGIPPEHLSQSDWKSLAGLEQRLRRRVAGQQAAVDAVVGAVQLGRLGLARGGRPLASLLLTGPAGVSLPHALPPISRTEVLPACISSTPAPRSVAF
jgi:ATP-dependent Clp protease ATP-binding subunit ClpA